MDEFIKVKSPKIKEEEAEERDRKTQRRQTIMIISREI